jgi:O-antigen ligase
MHAGLELSISHPLFGVGLDSYGDWYRQARGEISTLRTGPDRISNTAHNIFLDISSTAGLLAGLSYVSLVLLTGFWAAIYLKKSKRYSGRDVALISSWFAYQIQALVSINQIGVGVWGWIFTGAILGLVRIGEKERQDGLSAAQARGKMLSASSSLSAVIGLAAGLLLAFAPLRADIEFRSAQVNGDMERMRAAALSKGGTAWHLTLTLDYAIRSGNESFAYETAEILVERYPRDFFGWRVLETSPISTRIEEAIAKTRELDPFNPDLE